MQRRPFFIFIADKYGFTIFQMRSISLQLLLLLLLISACAAAQDKFSTKNGKIEFFSETVIEDIEAKNRKVAAVLDAKTGSLQFTVLMKAFEFEQPLMQEHFNDDYVESDKFPQAEFRGVIINNSNINYSNPGNYPARVKGRLTLHGVMRDIVAGGVVQVAPGFIHTSSTFYIHLSDYGIKLSTLASTMISNKIKITVSSRLDPM